MTVDAEKEAKRHHAIADLVMTILPELAGVTIERVAEGGSTEVYRIRHQSATYYLRVLPEVGASFAPEAKIHRQLHAGAFRCRMCSILPIIMPRSGGR
ncbi:MAG: hypothetical protein R2867_14695 [Caldilineaceae bacterium]